VTRLRDLDAYLSGELDDDAAAVLEDAMFDAPADTDLAFVDLVARGGRALVAHGTFDIGTTRSQLDALMAKGLTIQLVDAGPPGGDRTFEIRKAIDLLATRLPIGRTDLERVDVEVFVVNYNASKTIKDVLVDRTEGAIYGLCERALVDISNKAGPTITRVRETTGDRAVIAEWHLTGVDV
jgi:hypothetical protein